MKHPLQPDRFVLDRQAFTHQNLCVATPQDIPDSALIGALTRKLVDESLKSFPEFTPPAPFLGRIECFSAELARWGAKLNLTAAPYDPAELAFHILDSMMPLLLASADLGALTGVFAAGQRVLDLGSGAGFPGLILAAASEAEFVLTEARRKRASFLAVASASMGLRNVRIDSRHRTAFTAGFDVVTARAFAQPAAFYELSGLAVRPAGIRIFYASARQKPAIEQALSAIDEEPEFHEYDAPRPEGDHALSKESRRRMLVVSRRHSRQPR